MHIIRSLRSESLHFSCFYLISHSDSNPSVVSFLSVKLALTFIGCIAYVVVFHQLSEAQWLRLLLKGLIVNMIIPSAAVIRLWVTSTDLNRGIFAVCFFYKWKCQSNRVRRIWLDFKAPFALQTHTHYISFFLSFFLFLPFFLSIAFSISGTPLKCLNDDT